jgi:hypothetical protein
MWVRSQDRKILTEIHDVEIDSGFKVWGSGSLIGEYSTEEKALKVLDRIEELIENQCGLTFYMPVDDEVVTVKKRIDYAEFRMLEEKEK